MKNILSNTKIKPLGLGKNIAFAIYPNIYLPRGVYEKVIAKDPLYTAVLIHEEEHLKRQRRFGVLKWIFQYILSPKFRFDEEIAADIPRIKYLKSKKIKFDYKKRARELSSWIYLWCVGYEEAKRKLKSC